MRAERTEDPRPVSTKSVRLVTDNDDDLYSQNGELTVQDYDSASDFDTYESSFIDMENDEGRISRALHEWMTDYVVQDIEPRERMVREPLFSPKLGLESRFHRTESEDSIVTQISLLSCSSSGNNMPSKKRHRRRRLEHSHSKPDLQSKWIALANRRVGALDKMMKAQATQVVGSVLAPTDDIYDMLEKDEQRMVFSCGKTRGLHLGPGLKKSGSMTNIKDEIQPPQRRIASAGKTKFRGKSINFQEVRRQLIHQKLSHFARQQRILTRQSSRLSLRRKSRASITLPRQSSPSISTLEAFLFVPSESGTDVTSHDEVRTALWAGDAKILEIDLNRDLTSKVKRKIAITTHALVRVTGYGDDNGLRNTIGTIDEYPFLIEEDYSHVPKIAQKVRISPQLSQVIQQDIKVRMGRPRYHEISEQDLAMWNRGQRMDRKHRNLKVFTWLHSLREDEFDYDTEPQIDDKPPGPRVRTGDMIHIQAVDEPQIKPLLERLTSQYVV